MISRERLEELISQRATIYSTDWDETVELSPETCTVENIKISEYGEEIGEKLFVKEDELHIPSYRLSALEEDIETEKFKKEFQNITREEILNLPTYEEMIKEPRCLDCWTKEFVVMSNDIPIGKAFIGVDFDCEIVSVEMGSDKYFVEQLTKDNYIKACTIARKLFLGESVEEGENDEESKN